jgi:hypothetical protein
MSNTEPTKRIADPQDFLRILKDVFALNLEGDLEEKLEKFMEGKGTITLNQCKYTKQDLRDMFYNEQ